MSSTDRILKFIDYKGLSKREFYAKTNLSNGFLDKSTNVGADKLERIISAFPDLSLYYVVNGTGPMIHEGENTADTPVANINNGSQKGREMHEAQEPYDRSATKKLRPSLRPTSNNGTNGSTSLTLLSPQIITVDRRGAENIVYVPVRARAGYLTGYGDPEYVETLPSFSLPGLNDKSYRAFEVEGDSMNPTLKNGEMVIGQWVEKLDYIREDRVHILVTKNNGIVVKRLLNRVEKYGVIVAKSDATNNRNLYRNLEIKPEDIQEIWYGVWHGGFDFSSPSDMWQRVNNHEADLTVIQSTLEALQNSLKDQGLLK